MILADISAKARLRPAGRLGVVAASAEESAVLGEWKQRGWELTFFEGDPAQAVPNAMQAVLGGKLDMLFCSGASAPKIVRQLDRALQVAVPEEFDPLTLMQAIEVPSYPKLLWLGYTPGAHYAALAPAIRSIEQMVKTLMDLGEAAPRVALLSCVELVSPAVPSTVWEATLAHMSARGQFGAARVDGPLAFDLAVSPHAVTEKGIRSEVAGAADLLVPPDLNSYCTLADAIHSSGEHRAAGIIVGGPCPVAIPPHQSPRHVDLSLQLASLLVS